MVQQENLSLSSKVQSLEVENQHLHSRIEQLNNDLCHYENDKRRLESLVEENRRLDSSLVLQYLFILLQVESLYSNPLK